MFPCGTSFSCVFDKTFIKKSYYTKHPTTPTLNGCLKPHSDINIELRKIAKNNFGKDFFILMNNAIFRKNMENVRNHSNIKHVTTEAGRNYLVS